LLAPRAAALDIWEAEWLAPFVDALNEPQRTDFEAPPWGLRHELLAELPPLVGTARSSLDLTAYPDTEVIVVDGGGDRPSADGMFQPDDVLVVRGTGASISRPADGQLLAPAGEARDSLPSSPGGCGGVDDSAALRRDRDDRLSRYGGQ
jgi:hypothetical protein